MMSVRRTPAVMAALVASTLVLTGCAAPTPTASPSASAPADDPMDMDAIAAKTLKFAETLFGMAEAYAIGKIEEAGYEWRVVQRDLEMFPATKDYRPNRINLTIKEGIVYKVSVG
jgi:ABC-type phosphate transport system substrate-binding protein